MPRFRTRWWQIPLLVVLAIAATAVALYAIPSNHYVYLPDRIRPADQLVRVPNDKNQSTGNGIYMVDVIVRRASVLERLFPWIDDGATLVPAATANPLGVSDQERQQSGLQDMTLSQKLAAVVALRALGYKVRAHASGVGVNQIDPRAPAAKAFQIGDVIVRVGATPIRTTTQLQRHMAHVHPGSSVEVTVRRDSALRKVRAGTMPGKNAAGQRTALFGIIPEQEVQVRLPIKISIDSQNIGGPSAGLAFALDIVDELGPDIDRGRTIVATGEIALDGSVEPIGGIKQKTIAAHNAKASVFLVPKANAADARKYADGLKIVPVDNFRQALSYLKTS